MYSNYVTVKRIGSPAPAVSHVLLLRARGTRNGRHLSIPPSVVDSEFRANGETLRGPQRRIQWGEFRAGLALLRICASLAPLMASFLIVTLLYAQPTPHRGQPSSHQAAPKKEVGLVPSPWLSVEHLEHQIQFQEMLFGPTNPSHSEVEEHKHLELRGYKDAYLFWLRQRSFPNDTINWTAYLQAFAEQTRMFRASFRLAPTAPGIPPIKPPRWEFLGPTKLPVPYRQYYGEGFTSGRVNGVAIDPTDGRVIYLATAGGGLWKTTDKGQSWAPLSETDQWDNTKVSSVAIDAKNPNNVYAGTGDFDGGPGVYGFGIMKSTNGGADWTNVARQELKGFSVRRILIDPDASSIITVAAGHNPNSLGKLVRSEDGGNSWKVIQAPGIRGVSDADWEDLKCGAKAADGKRSCYAVGASYGGQVLRTTDQGRHWVKLNPPLSSDYQPSLAIAASPTKPGTVYLLSGTNAIILKSTDDGDSWTNITANFPAGNKNYNWSQNDYDFFIESSTRPDTGQDVLYVGLIDLIASPDGGTTWASVGHTYEDLAVTHNDQHCLAVNPGNPNELVLGNDGGAYLIAYDPAHNSWAFDTSINAQLGLTQFYSIDVDPRGNGVVLGGAQDNATPITFGDFSKWSNIGGGDGGQVLVNPANADVQYVTSQYLTIYKTKQGWRDWDSDNPRNNDITYTDIVADEVVAWTDDPVSFIAPVALDPNNPNVLYAGTNYLWRRDETAGKWESHLGSQMLAEPSPASVPNNRKDVMSVISVAPSDSKTIYTGSQMGRLWTTADMGKTWNEVSGGHSKLPRFWITTIAVHPSNPKTFFVGLSGTAGVNSVHPGHLWKCVSTMSAFDCKPLTGVGAGILPNIPVNKVVIDPTSPDNILFVATDIGVFVTKDGGVTWGDATKPLGLPNVQVNDLKILKGTDYLFAATFGRGAWRIKGLGTASLKPRPPRPALHR